MTTKLTLSVEKRIIQKAKRFAKQHEKSLSEIVTSYLARLVDANERSAEIDPEVLDLADEIPLEKLSRAHDARFQYLRKKYLHA
jgi:hypothetical protein